MGHYKYSLLIVGIFVVTSTGVNLCGTFQIRTVVNDYILAMDAQGLVRFVMLMGCCLCRGALSTAIYKQLMVHTAQKIVKEIRQDLFNKMQRLPLKYFDTNAHGDLMSRFTNDLDTVLDAMNNCFDNLIQSFMMITGTLVLIFVLNWQLSVIVLISMILMYLLIQYFSRRSRYYFKHQQKALGNLNGFIEEMVNGVKVVKVFNHEEKNLEEFDKRNHVLLDAAVKALTLFGQDDSDSCQHLLHQLCHRGLCRWFYGNRRYDRPGKSFFLFGIRQTDSTANQPIYPAIELFAGCDGRS